MRTSKTFWGVSCELGDNELLLVDSFLITSNVPGCGYLEPEFR